MSDSLDSLIQNAQERAHKRAIADLIHVAEETAKKRADSDPWLVAAYLTGSLRGEDPFLGNATDLDLVFVHAEEAGPRHEVLPLTREVHLDIVHRSRRDYDNAKALRSDPWLGYEIYDPLPLYAAQHFIEFVQAGVRDKFNAPENVLARSRRLLESARQGPIQLQVGQAAGPNWVLAWLNAVYAAANAVAVLTGAPLAERRFLLHFPERAEAAGQPAFAENLSALLGVGSLEADLLTGFLPAWQKDFLAAAASPNASHRLAAPRLDYYKQACETLLGEDQPQAAAWPLLSTWTLAASALPADHLAAWRSFCAAVGLSKDSSAEKLAGLERFVDLVEDALKEQAAAQGL